MTVDQMLKGFCPIPNPVSRPDYWGAKIIGPGRVSFRLWAPAKESVRLRIRGNDVVMEKDREGWHHAEADALPGDPYCYVMPNGEVIADPASRQQEKTVTGHSLVVDGKNYRWKQSGWSGRPWHEAVIHELHIGTFSDQGTFLAAIPHLADLADSGFTAIEIMPVAAFAGDRGWGYDGVLQYAPHPAYGTPDDLRQMVDAAHGLGLMVFLDVVYNHFGHLGNHLELHVPEFFSQEGSPWGPAPDFERPEVRRYFVDNAVYWLSEYHLDGLRFDAADCLVAENGEPELLEEIAAAVHSQVTDRQIHLMIEDARNVTQPMREKMGGNATCRAEWNDDFHHVAHVIATGETGGFYVNFEAERWRKLRRTLREGFVYQGETRPQDGKAVGEPSGDLPPTAFINFLQNHDQIGNRIRGERLLELADKDMVRALTEILLLSPHIPLMFMGEEFGSRQPFCFFCDHPTDMHALEREGRLKQAWLFQDMHGETVSDVPDPNTASTFLMSKLDRDAARSVEGKAWRDQVSALIDRRRRYIWPLLRDKSYTGSRDYETDDGSLAIDWQFGGHVLQLRANLTNADALLPPARGDVFHGKWQEDGLLGAFEVIFAVGDSPQLPDTAKAQG